MELHKHVARPCMAQNMNSHLPLWEGREIAARFMRAPGKSWSWRVIRYITLEAYQQRQLSRCDHTSEASVAGERSPDQKKYTTMQ